MSSLTNFGLPFLVLVSVGVEDFGAFTVAYVTYALAIAINRGFVCHPFAIRFSGRTQRLWAEATRNATGSSLEVGVAAAALAILAGVVAGGDTGASLVAVGVFFPLLLVQDTWRFAFFASARPGRALANDLVWALLLFAGLAVVVGSAYDDGSSVYVWVWAGTGALAGFVGALQSSLIPSVSGLAWWMRHQRDLGLKLALETTLARGGRRIALYSVGALAGLEALGSLNGARVLFGPMNVLYMGMFAFAIPEGVRLARKNIAALIRAVRVASAILVTTSLLLGLVLANLPLALALALVESLFEEEWDELARLIPPLTLAVAASGWVNGHRMGLRSLAAARHSLRAEAITGPAAIVGAAAGAAAGGALGAAVGLAVVDALSAVVWSVWFKSAADAGSQTGTGTGSSSGSRGAS